MPRTTSRAIALVVFLFSILFSTTQADLEVNADGNTQNVSPAMSSLLKRAEAEGSPPGISQRDALAIDQLIDYSKNNPRARELISDILDDKQEYLENLKENAPARTIVQSLKGVLSDLENVEALFQDPAKAIEQMTEAGYVKPENVEEYKANPDMLKDHVKHELYVAFLSMALGGGLLE